MIVKTAKGYTVHSEKLPLRISLGIFFISLATLTVEITLIHVFDVLLEPNLGYMTITCAMLSFALAGIYLAIKPLSKNADIFKLLFKFSIFFALMCLLIRPLMNILPFEAEAFCATKAQILYFVLMYFSLCLLFFSSGIITIISFIKFSNNIQQLYFWNLTGSALGCLLYIPFLPLLGPGGILICASALVLLTAALFSREKIALLLACLAGLITIIIPFINLPNIYDFTEHKSMRGLRLARESGQIEFSQWDPISKIDIVTMPKSHDFYKHIAYDGGTQSSFFHEFDGDFKKLRQDLPEIVATHHMDADRFLSHYLKRDTHQKVLIIGSAGGEEVLAALTYGASEVVGVELVKTVVDLGKGKYAKYLGNIFNYPNVRILAGEGRSFLRSQTDKYDIIQMYSIGTSSSIAGGAGATSPAYLQTTEAYKEYFTHLKPDGILQINFQYPARMTTTAARAWKELGMRDFQKHVVIFERKNMIFRPSAFIVKMSPWTEPELDDLKKFILSTFQVDKGKFRIFIDPLHPENNRFPSFFFGGDFPDEVAKKMDYFIVPSTDDKPYFSFIRKKLQILKEDPSIYLDHATAKILNSQFNRSKIPRDILHLVIVSIVSFGFSIIFILLPLLLSPAGKEKWPCKKRTMAYFSCLGAGFIIFELTFIQIFMKLIGYPLYSYTTVIFIFLLSAGIGSYYSNKNRCKGLASPFWGILVYGLLFIVFKDYLFNYFLAFSLIVRMAGAMLMILPLGFFLGMPFPLGVLAIQNKPQGAIAWAWGMNGLFTVIGGLLSIVFSIIWGFQATLFIALIIYGFAFLLYSKIGNVNS